MSNSQEKNDPLQTSCAPPVRARTGSTCAAPSERGSLTVVICREALQHTPSSPHDILPAPRPAYLTGGWNVVISGLMPGTAKASTVGFFDKLREAHLQRALNCLSHPAHAEQHSFMLLQARLCDNMFRGREVLGAPRRLSTQSPPKESQHRCHTLGSIHIDSGHISI